jgi:hypothetical protein
VRPDFDDSSSDDNDLETADVDQRWIAKYEHVEELRAEAQPSADATATVVAPELLRSELPADDAALGRRAHAWRSQLKRF